MKIQCLYFFKEKRIKMMSKMSDALKINLCINTSDITMFLVTVFLFPFPNVTFDALMHKLIFNASDILDIISIRFSLNQTLY